MIALPGITHDTPQGNTIIDLGMFQIVADINQILSFNTYAVEMRVKKDIICKRPSF